MSSSTKRVATYRERMRARGYRQIQMWVRDTRNPDFVEECRLWALARRNDPHERQILDELDLLADRDGWT